MIKKIWHKLLYWFYSIITARSLSKIQKELQVACLLPEEYGNEFFTKLKWDVIQSDTTEISKDAAMLILFYSKLYDLKLKLIKENKNIEYIETNDIEKIYEDMDISDQFTYETIEKEYEVLIK